MVFRITPNPARICDETIGSIIRRLPFKWKLFLQTAVDKEV